RCDPRGADQVRVDRRWQAAHAVSRGGPAVRLEGGARKGYRHAGVQGGGCGLGELRHGQGGGWHTDQLCRALAARGHEGRVLPYEGLVSRFGGTGPPFAAAGEDLTSCSAVLARIIPAGSLEQIIVRVDALHALEERGIPVINSPRAIDHDGRDVRAFVVGGRVIGAIERSAPGWKTNLARGGRARAVTLAAARVESALAAAKAVGADYAGVDHLPARDGTTYVVEVNGIPGWRGLQEATSSDVAG